MTHVRGCRLSHWALPCILLLLRTVRALRTFLLLRTALLLRAVLLLFTVLVLRTVRLMFPVHAVIHSSAVECS